MEHPVIVVSAAVCAVGGVGFGIVIGCLLGGLVGTGLWVSEISPRVCPRRMTLPPIWSLIIGAVSCAVILGLVFGVVGTLVGWGLESLFTTLLL